MNIMTIAADIKENIMAIVTIHSFPREHFGSIAMYSISSTQDEFVHQVSNLLPSYIKGNPVAYFETGENAAEEAFDLTNNPSRYDEKTTLYGDCRSVSVGDVVEVQDHDTTQRFLCMTMGWKEI